MTIFKGGNPLGSKNHMAVYSKQLSWSRKARIGLTITSAVALYHFSPALANSDTKKLQNLISNQVVSSAVDKTRVLLRPGFNQLDINISGGENLKPEGEITGLRAYDNGGEASSFIFNQIGLNSFDGRTTLNLGVGYRSLSDDDKWMFGANLFYDHEFPNDHQRYGTGLEMLSSAVKLSTNMYKGISDYKKDKSGIESKALDGVDAKLELSLPYMPGTKLTYKSFKWDGIDGASDIKGNTVGLKGYVTDSLLLEAGRTDFTGNSSTSSRNEVRVSYKIRLGDTSTRKVHQISEKAYELLPLGNERYEPVERENRIIKQKKFAATVSGV